jgi:hypothetical protein
MKFNAMKKITVLILIFCFSIFSYSQNYNSIPIQYGEVKSPIDVDFMGKVLMTKQRAYENSKKISCYSLMNFIIEKGSSSNYIEINSSSMLSGVRYYYYNGEGYVIIWVKNNTYDSDYKPYIYCGISKERWNYFTSYGEKSSWGESFHYYIKDYSCDCR